MPDIPEEWRAYAALQSKLDCHLTTDSKAWGMEAGLNALLDGTANAETVMTTIDSAARRSRYAQSLVAKYILRDVTVDHVAYLEARSALTKIAAHFRTSDIKLMMTGVVVGGLRGAERTRLSRMRAKVRALVA